MSRPVGIAAVSIAVVLAALGVAASTYAADADAQRRSAARAGTAVPPAPAAAAPATPSSATPSSATGSKRLPPTVAPPRPVTTFTPPTIVYVPVPAVPWWADARFGALAYGPAAGQVGYSYNYPTEGEAQAAALNYCGLGCVLASSFANGCGVLAAGPAGAFVLRGTSQSDAFARLASVCPAGACRTLAWACNG
jgi:hypothetical protein